MDACLYHSSGRFSSKSRFGKTARIPTHPVFALPLVGGNGASEEINILGSVARPLSTAATTTTTTAEAIATGTGTGMGTRQQLQLDVDVSDTPLLLPPGGTVLSRSDTTKHIESTIVASDSSSTHMRRVHMCRPCAQPCSGLLYAAINGLWLKFAVMWRFFRLWALFDGIQAPENIPRCNFEGITLSARLSDSITEGLAHTSELVANRPARYQHASHIGWILARVALFFQPMGRALYIHSPWW